MPNHAASKIERKIRNKIALPKSISGAPNTYASVDLTNNKSSLKKTLSRNNLLGQGKKRLSSTMVSIEDQQVGHFANFDV
jgi:hypothetical protein